MEVLIFGCGSLARHIVPTLLREEHKITVLGQHQECMASLSQQLDIQAVQITGVLLLEDLRRGNIDGADVFIALGEDDNQNAMAAQIASHIFNVDQVVCHIGDVTRYDAYKRMGLEVVCSTAVVGDAIRGAMRSQS